MNITNYRQEDTACYGTRMHTANATKQGEVSWACTYMLPNGELATMARSLNMLSHVGASIATSCSNLLVANRAENHWSAIVVVCPIKLHPFSPLFVLLQHHCPQKTNSSSSN
jgi:hypothetical protein